jgi:ribosomal protein L28
VCSVTGKGSVAGAEDARAAAGTVRSRKSNVMAKRGRITMLGSRPFVTYTLPPFWART